MAYTWLGMRKMGWEEVQERYKENTLNGCYKLYDDGTEGAIGPFDSWQDIVDHKENGGEFGEEIDTVELELPDGKKIIAPAEVDVSALGCLDEMEYELWHTIEQYFVLFGIRTEDDEPDWATVKGVQEKLIEILEESGVKFEWGNGA